MVFGIFGNYVGSHAYYGFLRGMKKDEKRLLDGYVSVKKIAKTVKKILKKKLN